MGRADAEVSTVIDSLRRHRVGQLYWLNLCAQISERAIDAAMVYEALATAYEKYTSEYSGKAAHDHDEALLVALIAETCRTNDAMTANRRTRALNEAEVDSLKTILSGETLWNNYLELEPAAQVMRVQRVSSLTGVIPTLTDDELGDAVLKRCWDTKQHELGDLFATGAKHTLLRTRARRFWAGVAESARPQDAERLVLKLGIMGMKAGTWIIELTYKKDQLIELLGERVHEAVGRPSALCPNDMRMPRFRALRSTEIGSFARGEELDAFGMTVDLHEWTGANIDGLFELICPALVWRVGSLPSIRLLGDIKNPPVDPHNGDFAHFLRGVLQITEQSEEDAIRHILDAPPIQ